MYVIRSILTGCIKQIKRKHAVDVNTDGGVIFLG